MTRPTYFWSVLVFGFVVTTLPALLSAAEKNDEAKNVAIKVTTAGAALFDAKDAKGLAATYTEDARLEIITREGENGPLKTEVRNGRADVESYYESVLKPDSTFHSKNDVEHARFIEPDLLLITGTFTPDTQTADPLKLPFVQTRQKQGDSWRIVSLQIYGLPQK